MYPTVSGEAVFFAACMGAGALSAFIYDVLRISRRIVNANTLAVNLEDILFFIAAALILFYTAYIKNSGEIRWQGFVGGGCGVLLYAVVARNRFVDCGTAMVLWLMKLFVAVVRMVFFPIRIILRVLKKPVSIVAWYTGRSLRRIKGIVRNGKTRAKNRLKSAFFVLRKK